MPSPRKPLHDQQFTPMEIRVLWQLKRHGPYVRVERTNKSILNKLANDVNYPVGSVRGALGGLEARSLVLRTYKNAPTHRFANQGHNPVLRIELVDPNMELPPEPPALPLAIVVAHENEELQERIVQRSGEPTADDIVDALIFRINELQSQVDALRERLITEAEKNERLQKAAKLPARVPLTERVQAALTQEQWDKLRRGEKL